MHATCVYKLQGLENLHRAGAIEISNNGSLLDAGALNQVHQARNVVIEHNRRLCSRFGSLWSLTQVDRVAMSENVGLDIATLARFGAPNLLTVAAR